MNIGKRQRVNRALKKAQPREELLLVIEHPGRRYTLFDGTPVDMQADGRAMRILSENLARAVDHTAFVVIDEDDSRL